METIKIVISGTVQGVGYRYYAKRAADSLGVKGWVRNLLDGTVEVLAQAPDKVKEELFIAALREGPSYGTVTGIECTPLTYAKDYDSFDVIY